MSKHKRQRPVGTPRKGSIERKNKYNETMKSAKEKELEETIVSLSEEIAELYKTINEKNTENYTMNYKITMFEKTIKKQNTIIADQNEKLKDQLSMYKFMYQEVIQKDAEITRKDAEITQKDLTLKILHAQLGKQFTDLRKVLSLNEHLRKQLDKYLLSSPSAPNGISNSPVRNSSIGKSLRI